MGSSCSCLYEQNEEEPKYIGLRIKHRDAFHLIDYHQHADEEITYRRNIGLLNYRNYPVGG